MAITSCITLQVTIIHETLEVAEDLIQLVMEAKVTRNTLGLLTENTTHRAVDSKFINMNILSTRIFRSIRFH